jgi:hypothetical protein
LKQSLNNPVLGILCKKKGIIECFPAFHDFVAELETPPSPEIASEIIEHLKNLQVSIKEYFPPLKKI